MDIAGLINKVKLVIHDNQTTILSGLSVTGVASTGVLAFRAGMRTNYTIELEDKLKNEDGAGGLTNREKFELTWKESIPPVLSGTATIASIIFAHRAAAKQVAAFALASSLSERAFQEYKNKVIEQLGEKKDISIRDSIAQKKVDEHPVHTREVILAGTGEVLCFDIYSGRYFQSSVEEIKKAENKMNFDIINHSYGSLSQFYEEIGLPPTGVSDDVGWNLDNQLTVHFSTTMSSDQRPCIAIDFATHPQPRYNRFD